MFARLRPVLLDLVAFLFLLASLAPGMPGWMRTVSVVYAGVVVVLRVASMAMTVRLPETGVPDGVFHVLYGASVVAAGLAKDWLLAGLWAVIWALSLVSTRTARAAQAVPAPPVPRATTTGTTGPKARPSGPKARR